MHQTFEIVKYTEKHREQLIEVWEKSVLATHDFLNAPDFIEIKKIVKTIDFSAFETYCLLESNNVIGFLGTANQKIEMLFLSPEHIGTGLGAKLLNFAVHELNATQVDVNEQNLKAVAFYSKSGFKTYERTNQDDQGKNYPLLRMELTSL
ncbi:MAG: GNAT family N-acetyltransferase [Bacteroidia bacterium]